MNDFVRGELLSHTTFPNVLQLIDDGFPPLLETWIGKKIGRGLSKYHHGTQTNQATRTVHFILPDCAAKNMDCQPVMS